MGRLTPPIPHQLTNSGEFGLKLKQTGFRVILANVSESGFQKSLGPSNLRLQFLDENISNNRNIVFAYVSEQIAHLGPKTPI